MFTARGADDEAELIRRIDRARVAINIRAHARFTDGVMTACRNLEMISIWGTGTDNVDLDAAGRHGITVCNTPGINAFAVAEHTLALMLATARRIPRVDREVRSGAWPRDMLTQLLGKTLGVFGTGKIGARVISLAKAFGMDVLAYSARGDTAAVAALGARAASKDEILRAADVVTLHLRLAPDTRGFLGRRELALMKPTAILVNTGRGAWSSARRCSTRSGADGSPAPGSTCSTTSRSSRTTPCWPCPASCCRRTTPARRPRSSATACCAPSRTSRTIWPASRPMSSSPP